MQLPAGGLHARKISQHVSQRMADVGDRDLCLFVKPGLEREQGQHFGDGALDLTDAPAAPDPDRRAHVMYRGNASRLELQLEIEIEIRGVDTDKTGGRLSQKMLGNATPNADDFEI